MMSGLPMDREVRLMVDQHVYPAEPVSSPTHLTTGLYFLFLPQATRNTLYDRTFYFKKKRFKYNFHNVIYLFFVYFKKMYKKL